MVFITRHCAEMCNIEEQILQRTATYKKVIAKHTYQVRDLVLVQNYLIAGSFGHARNFRLKGPFRICYITRKCKVDLADAIGLRLKGWHTDKLHSQYLLSESDRGTLEISADIAKNDINGITEGKECFREGYMSFSAFGPSWFLLYWVSWRISAFIPDGKLCISV
jgi:hypothetical protein